MQQDAASAQSQGMSDARVLSSVLGINFEGLIEGTFIVLAGNA